MAGGMLKRNKQAIFYGISLAVLLLLLKWLEWHFVIATGNFEMYAGIIALLFTGLGVWLAFKLIKPKTHTITVEKTVPIPGIFVLNTKEIEQLRISSREMEVLALIAAGLSNRQIAERLFVSLNTIKTHCANIFIKLEVKSRTQAIEKAKRLSLIP